MTVSGKAQKFKMREVAIEELGLIKKAAGVQPAYAFQPVMPA